MRELSMGRPFLILGYFAAIGNEEVASFHASFPVFFLGAPERYCHAMLGFGETAAAGAFGRFRLVGSIRLKLPNGLRTLGGFKPLTNNRRGGSMWLIAG